MKNLMILLILVLCLNSSSAQLKAQFGWTKWDKSNSSIPFEKVAYIDFDKSENPWFGTNVTGSNGHLCHFDGIDFYPESYSAWIYDIKTDQSGNIWIINSNEELKSWDGSNWSTFTNSKLSWYSDPLFIDSKGNKWMNPGFDADLLKFDGTNWLLISDPLLSPKINAIKEYNNKLFIATDNGLLCYDGIWEKFDKANSNLPDNKVIDIEIDNNDSLWLLCAGGNLVSIKDTTWNIYNSSLISSYPIGLEISGNNDLWIVLDESIVKFDKENYNIFNSGNSILPASSILCLEINNKEEIWIGTRNGLFMYLEKPDSTIGIDKKKDLSEIKVFNSSSELFINIDRACEFYLKILNSSGQIVLNRKFKTEQNQVINIDLSFLPTGLYIAEFENTKNATFYKFIIK